MGRGRVGGGVPTAASATLVVGPAVLGKILANEHATKLLTTAYKAGPGTKGFVRAMGQLAVLANDFKKEVASEEPPAPRPTLFK